MPVDLSDPLHDDDDLPSEAAAAKVVPPKDPVTGRFLPSEPTSPAEPATHSSYALSKARQFGIHDAAQMTPTELDRLLAHAERLQPQQVAAPKEPEEEPIDWGTDSDGKALTEKDFVPAIARAIKAAHELGAIKKQNADLRDKIDQQERQRAERLALKAIHGELAKRPDLFGEKPGGAAPGTPEAQRYGLVLAHINGLLQNKTHSTPEADAAAAVALFGPAAAPGNKPPTKQPAKPARPTLADYQAAEMAVPTSRRGTEHLTQRQQRIEQIAAAQRDNGVYHPAPTDDDDDLPSG